MSIRGTFDFEGVTWVMGDAKPWNWCPKCDQDVQDDMRTGEFRDGSTGTCIGCNTVYEAVAYQDGSWGLHECDGSDEPPESE